MTALNSPGGLPQLKRMVLRDDVYDAVLDMLMEQRLTPGSVLSIDRLARDLGVSPTPVREALAYLEHTGLVRRAALKGYTVAPLLSAEQIAELMDARSVVELAALDRALARNEDLLPRLRRAHQAHLVATNELVASDSGSGQSPQAVRAYFEADWGFHLVILEASGNAFLQQMMRGLGASVHRMLQRAGRGVVDWELALGEHGRVLAAVEGRNPAAVRQAMRAHLASVGDRSRAETGVDHDQETTHHHDGHDHARDLPGNAAAPDHEGTGSTST